MKNKQRVIRFRAWHKKEKKMFYMDSHNCWVTISERIDVCLDGSVFIRGFILMQFTGLKDKSGKEIYESDLVEYNPMGSTQVKTEEVKYKESTCSFEPLNKAFGKVKVVGNKYEK